MRDFFSSAEYIKKVSEVELHLREHLNSRREAIHQYSPELLKSMEYSLFTGGKRFRPVLSMITLGCLGVDSKEALPWACALEMVHTYSLIHDDLPCMDNDDVRRGQPTNHKKFGEAVALLAGDALLTESFLLLAAYKDHSEFSSLLTLLANSIGASGMVGGQTMDMGSGQPMDSIEALQKMHQGKTGTLISAAVEGAGFIAHSSNSELQALRQLGGLIGLAFQIKDDILDMQEADPRSYIRFLGVEGTQKALDQVNAEAEKCIGQLPDSCAPLRQFISANNLRNK